MRYHEECPRCGSGNFEHKCFHGHYHWECEDCGWDSDNEPTKKDLKSMHEDEVIARRMGK